MNTHPEHIGNQLTYLTDKELQRVLLQYQKIAGFDSTEKMLSHLKEVALCKQFDYMGQIIERTDIKIFEQPFSLENCKECCNDQIKKDEWFGAFLEGKLAIKINNGHEYLAFYDYLSKNNVNLALWKMDTREYDPFFSYFFMNNKNGAVMDASRDAEHLMDFYDIRKVLDFSELNIYEEKEDVDMDR